MKSTLLFCAAWLLTTTTAAQAGESESASVPAPEATTQAPASPASAPLSPSAPTDAKPVQPATQAVVQNPVSPPPSQPEPYIGWGRGVRAPIYVNLMLSVGALAEDGDNRLTTRSSKILEGFGGTLRLGAVLGEHHRLGVRMQSFVRPTKQVLLDASSSATTTNQWGAVTFGFVGPEYLYTTDFGLYLGGSLGIGAAFSRNKLDDHKDDNSIERGSAGVAGVLSLGYEWRANKWFALNAEVYGGLYHGIDDNEKSMNNAIFGLGMGLGF